MKYLLSIIFLGIAFMLFSQTNQGIYEAYDSIKTRVRVIEKHSRHPLQGVSLVNNNGDTLMITDKNGLAKTKTLSKLNYLTAKHEGHLDAKFKLRNDPFDIIKKGSAIMEPTDSLQFGGSWLNRRQNISFAVNELINTAFAFRYTYSLSKRNAVGIHLSTYLKVLFPVRGDIDNYNGFKLTALYQFHMVSNIKSVLFIEPKLSFGYFNSDKVSYSYDNSQIEVPEEFWTFGGGISFGISSFIKKKLSLTYLVGLQYFPFTGSNTAPDPYSYYSRGPAYFPALKMWEITGPGAIIEMKFLIGWNFK